MVNRGLDRVAADPTPEPLSRAPLFALLAGTVIVFITLGMRHSFGLFLPPVTLELGLGREVFGFAVALQNLLWGLGQPIAGIAADKLGSGRVVVVGGILYAAGLAFAAFSTTAGGLYLGFGGLIGLGLSATSYAVVLGAIGRRFPAERRTRALGLASVGGSLGMFLSVPATVALLDQFAWSSALLILAAAAGVVVFLAVGLSGGIPADTSGQREQSLRQALGEAAGHRGYLLLILGFFVCGFQLAFVGTHIPAYLIDRGMPANTGGTALAIIGFTNIIGTFCCGLLGDWYSKRKVLAVLYTMRALATLYFLYAPLSIVSVSVFAAVMGLTWLGTVPLTSGIVAQVFGPRYLATLVGFVFLMHQIGSFLGAWLGGFVYDRTGSYEPVWWCAAVLAALAAAVHLMIDERPVVRLEHGQVLAGR